MLPVPYQALPVLQLSHKYHRMLHWSVHSVQPLWATQHIFKGWSSVAAICQNWRSRKAVWTLNQNWTFLSKLSVPDSWPWACNNISLLQCQLYESLQRHCCIWVMLAQSFAAVICRSSKDLPCRACACCMLHMPLQGVCVTMCCTACLGLGLFVHSPLRCLAFLVTHRDTG